MPEDRIAKLIMEWVPEERRKRGRLRKTWMEGVQAAMTARNLEQYQLRNREEWRLVSEYGDSCYKTGQIESGRGATLTPHPLLVPRSKTE
jgi:hypothetical protein